MDNKIGKIQELIYEIRVGDVMKRNVITVSPQTQMSQLREILRDKRVSGTPVMESDKLVGIISIEDFIKWLANRESDCPISEKMSKDVQILYADEPLTQAVNKFEQYGFGRFAVIDRQDERLVGIITKGAIVEGLLKKLEIDHYQEEEVYRHRIKHFFEDILADKVLLFFQYNVVGQDFKHAGEGASRLKSTLRRLGMDPQVIRRVAIATGIMASGAGLGGILVPLIVILINKFEWRLTLVIIGLGIWGVILPLSLLLRHEPEQYDRLFVAEILTAVRQAVGGDVYEMALGGDPDALDAIREKLGVIGG